LAPSTTLKERSDFLSPSVFLSDESSPLDTWGRLMEGQADRQRHRAGECRAVDGVVSFAQDQAAEL
jgi:hypothetical protein